MPKPLTLAPDRLFTGSDKQKAIAQNLYEPVRNLSLICPHGHVDPRLLADPDFQFGSPTELFIIPDHYVFRLLYSQGVPMASLGVPRQDGGVVEQDHRKIWQIFAEHFYLFRGTPTGLWINQELHDLFGVRDALNGESAQRIYDHIAQCLAQPAFRPRALFEQFNIETLCTTDAATDDLKHHAAIKQSGWPGQVRPTFRPDAVVNLDTDDWHTHIHKLSDASRINVDDYTSFITALQHQRTFFKQMGAAATDHAARTPYTVALSSGEANAIFERALRGKSDAHDAARFTGHMLMVMARMSIDDGLVMQLHVGSHRNHNNLVAQQFGRDKGADIPIATDYTNNLLPLLNAYGNDARLGLILFTLDETTYARELAPLAGHYPAVKLGPPWWFYDSVNGMRRYFDWVMETASIYNTAGFNDDTRAFCSIPARHDVWRRCCCDWLAGLVVSGQLDEDAASEMAHEMSYGLAKRAYRL